MKGVKTNINTNLQKFYLNCTTEEITIIKQGLGHLQLNYINILHDVHSHFNYSLTQQKLNQVSQLINELKKIENE